MVLSTLDGNECLCHESRLVHICCLVYLHAVLLCVLRAVCTIEKFPLEKLDSDDSKDEHEELVNNEYVEDILQGSHNTVKDSLQEKAKPKT